MTTERPALERLVGTLIADCGARTILITSTGHYVGSLHVLEHFRAAATSEAARDAFVRPTLLLASALTFVGYAAEKTWEDSEELNKLRLSVADSMISTIVDLAGLSTWQSMIVDRAKERIFNEIKKNLDASQPPDGGDTVVTFGAAVLAALRIEIFATQRDTLKAAKEFDRLKNDVRGRLFDAVHDLENRREHVENE